MRKKYLILLLIVSSIAIATPKSNATKSHNAPSINKQEQTFITHMVNKDHFRRTHLKQLFKSINMLPAVLQHIENPYEAQPWYIYKIYFLSEDRARAGAMFWLNHAHTLARAEAKYGVPAEIIVAIVGVETDYGQSEGTYPVLDSLATLAFAYPPRAKFFRYELEQYLLLTRKLKLNPKTLLGSYAGALGYPQFMPDSYLDYGVNFDGNNNIDLFHDSNDAIASVANFLQHAGWLRRQLATMPVHANSNKYTKLLNSDLHTVYRLKTIESYGITPKGKTSKATKANLLQLKDKKGNEIWITFHNFYVITHYNSSPEYAMAVYQLAQKIKSYYEK